MRVVGDQTRGCGAIWRWALTSLDFDMARSHAAKRMLAPVWLPRVVSYLFITLVCVIYAFSSGKDLNWDLLNYHFYAGFSAVNDRFSSDFFPASLQSYLNPYAYVPFYVLVSAGAPDWFIACLFAAFASTGIWAVWEIAVRFCNDADARHNVTMWCPGLAAATFALLAPIFFVQLGSSFADATTAVLVLWAFALILWNKHGPRDWHLFVAGLLLGSASALKLTNVLYALVAIVPLLAIPNWSARATKIKTLLIFTASTAVGASIVGLPWASKLLAEFSNPVFPMLNGIFQSPDFPQHQLSHLRYVPNSLVQALSLPIDIARPERYVYTEVIAPDLRFAVLFVLMAVAAVLFGRKFILNLRGRTQKVVANVRGGYLGNWRLVGTTLSFLLAWIVWTIVSANGRYFMPMLLLASALVVGWVWHLSRNWRWRLYAIVAVLLSQLAVVAIAAEERWSGSPWTGRWFELELPPELTDKPILLISASTQSNSFLAPFLHSGSSLINASGQFALVPDRPGWERVERLLEKHRERVYFLFESYYVNANNEAYRIPHRALEATSTRFGMRMEPEKCIDVFVGGLPSQKLQTAFPSGKFSDGFSIQPHAGRYLIFCPAVVSSEMRVLYSMGARSIQPLFSKLERSCPSMFSPSEAPTEGGANLWWRTYLQTDSRITVDSEHVRISRLGEEDSVIGSVSEVMEGTDSLKCVSSRIRKSD